MRELSHDSNASVMSSSTPLSPEAVGYSAEEDEDNEMKEAIRAFPTSDVAALIPTRKTIYPCFSQYDPDKLVWRVHVEQYSTSWTHEFQAIANHLTNLFDICSSQTVAYTSIEHIGSTAIPDLCAKPNIDVLVTLSNATQLANAIDALLWEIPGSATGFVRYTRVPNGGGIQGRESFKLYINDARSLYFNALIERSVYLVNEDPLQNSAGPVHVRCYRDVRDTLRKPQNRDLLDEYAAVKWALSNEEFASSLTYAERKDDVIRKILRRAGWSDEEVDVKEQLARRVEWSNEEEEAY